METLKLVVLQSCTNRLLLDLIKLNCSNALIMVQALTVELYYLRSAVAYA